MDLEMLRTHANLTDEMFDWIPLRRTQSLHTSEEEFVKKFQGTPNFEAIFNDLDFRVSGSSPQGAVGGFPDVSQKVKGESGSGYTPSSRSDARGSSSLTIGGRVELIGMTAENNAKQHILYKEHCERQFDSLSRAMNAMTDAMRRMEAKLDDPLRGARPKIEPSHGQAFHGSDRLDQDYDGNFDRSHQRRSAGRGRASQGHDRPAQTRLNLPVLPRSTTFNGTGCWDTFESKFRSFVQTYELDDFEQIKFLLSSGLTEKAATFFENNNRRNVFTDTEQMYEVMSEKFGDRKLATTALCEFNSAEQEQGESVTDWADRVDLLAEKAFSDDQGQNGIQVMLRFCMGLTNREARTFILLKEPESIQECVQLFKLFESTHRATSGRSQNIRSIASWKKQEPSHVTFQSQLEESPRVFQTQELAVQKTREYRTKSPLEASVDKLTAAVTKSSADILQAVTQSSADILQGLQENKQHWNQLPRRPYSPQPRSVPAAAGQDSSGPGNRGSRTPSPVRSDRQRQNSKSPSFACWTCGSPDHRMVQCPYNAKNNHQGNEREYQGDQSQTGEGERTFVKRPYSPDYRNQSASSGGVDRESRPRNRVSYTNCKECGARNHATYQCPHSGQDMPPN